MNFFCEIFFRGISVITESSRDNKLSVYDFLLVLLLSFMHRSEKQSIHSGLQQGLMLPEGTSSNLLYSGGYSHLFLLLSDYHGKFRVNQTHYWSEIGVVGNNYFLWSQSL